jgi:hypothetical protein
MLRTQRAAEHRHDIEETTRGRMIINHPWSAS